MYDIHLGLIGKRFSLVDFLLHRVRKKGATLFFCHNVVDVTWFSKDKLLSKICYFGDVMLIQKKM